MFSPHLCPELGGRPQVRERVFILAHYVGPERGQDPGSFDDPIVTPRRPRVDWARISGTSSDLPLRAGRRGGAEVPPRVRRAEDDRDLGQAAGGRRGERLEPGERLPGFPIWFDDFRPLDEAEDLIEAAKLRGEPLPRVEARLPCQERRFYERHRAVIGSYRPLLDAFPPSRRKFEWQAGEHRPLADTIMHFRPSGIRAKRPDYVPALVAITQTSILGDRRRLTPRETARLQGLPDSFEFVRTTEEGPVVQRDPASYKQMGNGVNVGAAYYVFCEYVRRHRKEIPGHVVAAVEHAPSNPDEVLAR